MKSKPNLLVIKLKAFIGGKLSLEEYVAYRQHQGASTEEIRNEVLEKFFLSAFGHKFDQSDLDESAYVTPKYKWACAVSWEACEKCQERHGQCKTWEEWEKEGLPGSEKVCSENCRCSLIPEEIEVL